MILGPGGRRDRDLRQGLRHAAGSGDVERAPLPAGLHAIGWFSVAKFLPGQASMAMVRTTGEHLLSGGPAR